MQPADLSRVHAQEAHPGRRDWSGSSPVSLHAQLVERGEARIELDLAATSDVGLRRRINEDSYVVLEIPHHEEAAGSSRETSRRRSTSRPRAGAVLIVADGIGGHGDGDIASAAVVDFMAQYATRMMPGLVATCDGDPQELSGELTKILRYVHKRLAQAAVQNDLSRAMGTTLTLAYVAWPRAYVVHSGDSRCYLHRDGLLVQLTKDHTVAQRMVRYGLLAPEEMAASRYSHMLYNCLGGGNGAVFAEVHEVILEPADELLLCTDGLSGCVPGEQIEEILADSGSARDACTRLVSAANVAGGRDNVTVALCRATSR